MYDFIAQAVGIIGAVATILSYQFKNNRTLYMMQAFSGLMFSINFLMLGSYTASIFNFINLFRGGLLSCGKTFKSWWFAGLFMTLYTVMTVFTYDSWVSILILVAQLVGTVTMWSQNGKWIRIGQMAVISPAWLTNNIVCFSVGGIITEVFCFCSVIVYFIRCKLSQKKA